MMGISSIILFALVLCAFMCLYRIGRGPSAPDRAMGIDILGTLIVAFTALIGLHTGKDWYLSIALAWALLSFIGAIALAKYLEGRAYDE
ncbi:MAG: cation:proton antiporter [Planctomycetota bacterium]|nr:MAG: cation:proton antiporter [Planctomycetota bacterium]